MNRNTTIDFVKFFAMIFIVYIHASSFEQVSLFGIEGEKIHLTIDTFARFGVPFFFMVSGFLVVNQVDKRGGKYFTNYVWKLVKLYAAWFLFFVAYDLVFKIIDEGLSSPVIVEYFRSFTPLQIFYYGAGHSQYHLWYLLAAIWGMIIFAIFYYFNKMNLLLLFSFLLHLLGMFNQSYSGIYNFELNSRDGVFFGLFYITLGAVFAKNQKIKDLSTKIKPHVWLYAFFGFSLLQLVERVYLMYWMDGKEGNYFMFTILVSISLFMFVISKPNIGEGSWVNSIGKKTVGIYVAHPVILNLTNRFTDYWEINFIRDELWWGILLTPYFFFAAYVLYILLQKVKTTTIHRLKRNTL